MTYIVTLDQEQFTELYQILVDRVDIHPPTILSILHSMDIARDHYNEREAVLRELLGIPYNPNI